MHRFLIVPHTRSDPAYFPSGISFRVWAYVLTPKVHSCLELGSRFLCVGGRFTDDPGRSRTIIPRGKAFRGKARAGDRGGDDVVVSSAVLVMPSGY